jgi:hypothetical protein
VTRKLMVFLRFVRRFILVRLYELASIASSLYRPCNEHSTRIKRLALQPRHGVLVVCPQCTSCRLTAVNSRPRTSGTNSRCQLPAHTVMRHLHCADGYAGYLHPRSIT